MGLVSNGGSFISSETHEERPEPKPEVNSSIQALAPC